MRRHVRAANMPKKIPPKPVALSPREAASFLSVSRSRIYELISAGEVVACKDGARTLISTASCEEWLGRLRPFPTSPPPTSPLLPPEDRKLARRRARELATGPLLPVEQQQLAVEPATEPEPPAPPVELASDFAAIYRERIKLVGGDPGQEEPRLRAIEFTVNACRANTGLDLEQAKRIVLAAIAKETTSP
jgi:excisionase family DNA binding protein